MKYREMTTEYAQQFTDLVVEHHEARNELLSARLSSDPQKLMDAADHYRRVVHELGAWLEGDDLEQI